MKKKIMHILRYGMLALAFVVLIVLVGNLIWVIGNISPIERAVKNWLSGDVSQELCGSPKLLEDTRAVATVNDACVPWPVLRGIKDCEGRYAVFVEKIGDEWVVDESSVNRIY